jgi:hypothetical protein
MKIGSAAMIVSGIILLATPVGGVLLAGGVGSLAGGVVNEINGGSFSSGWVGGLVTGVAMSIGSSAGLAMIKAASSATAAAGLGTVMLGLGGFAVAGTTGFLGAFGGNLITQKMDGVRNLDLNAALVAGAVGGLFSMIALPFSIVPDALIQNGYRAGAAFVAGGTELVSGAISNLFDWYYTEGKSKIAKINYIRSSWV